MESEITSTAAGEITNPATGKVLTVKTDGTVSGGPGLSVTQVFGKE